MLRYIIQRLLLLPFLVLLFSIIVFGLVQAPPGDFLTSYIATLRFMLQFAKTGETPVTEFLRGRMKGALGVLNTHLETHRFAIGDNASIADLSMCGYLYWPDEFGVDWVDYPNVGRWLAAIAAMPGWVHPYKLMPGHPLPVKA